MIRLTRIILFNIRQSEYLCVVCCVLSVALIICGYFVFSYKEINCFRRNSISLHYPSTMKAFLWYIYRKIQVDAKDKVCKFWITILFKLGQLDALMLRDYSTRQVPIIMDVRHLPYIECITSCCMTKIQLIQLSYPLSTGCMITCSMRYIQRRATRVGWLRKCMITCSMRYIQPLAELVLRPTGCMITCSMRYIQQVKILFRSDGRCMITCSMRYF